MPLCYDEILADNSFGQIIFVAPNTNTIMSSSMTNNSDINTNEDKSLSLMEQYGFSLDNLFDIARQFLKDKQGSKAIQLKYAENVRFVALSKQATIGKWDPSYTPNVGLLDVVGNDRKQAWIALGDMSKDQAKEEFIKLLLERCRMFEHHLEAHHVENEEKDRLKKEDEARRLIEQEAERVKQYELEQVSRLEEQKKKREEFQRKQIQDALNQQTYPQFKNYAEQQFKDNRQAQDELIRQLQEQHFQQYMQKVYQQQLLYQQQHNRTKPNMEQQSTTLPFINQMSPLGPAPTQLPPVVHPPSQPFTNGTNSMDEIKTESTIPIQSHFESLSLNTSLQPSARNDLSQQQFPSVQINNEFSGTQQSIDEHSIDNDMTINSNDELSNEDGTREYPNLAPANMWTRKDIKEFKDAVRKEKEAVIKIGSGETVTVRVPTHEDGRCIFWEFATDYYDIGFGLYFEWSQVQSNTVTVHVSDSSEDEEDEGEDGTNQEKKDIEKGSRISNKPPRPYQDEIVPIFRRDSHEEIYAGSHPYPGNGVYLLKFDNSYSLWRSKTLYYRVYYSR
ncbi:unnamed protein product [Rotaria sordida]|uniref:Golgi resident protein GCP60 n=1 Tax=Rotaria sordida TaxID=392033 RepID=A0A813Y3W1_9BILA|nr:unnamed protein product [Rotaria sordida]CAF3629960.1 unnamed protein product [Rotaria sordida]